MKTQQPVILNDNPGVALDSKYEYSGTVDKRAGHYYILTAQDLLTK